MCISWQWPLWTLWIMILPLMIHSGHWFGGLGTITALGIYLLPTLWVVVSTLIASLETKRTYAEPITAGTFCRRMGRLLPYIVLNTGMLPHQFSAFAEGLFGSLHSEFERTPKSASMTATSPGAGRRRQGERSYRVKVHWPYVAAELFYVGYQVGWMVIFIADGLVFCAVGALYMASSVIFLGFHYGDHLGRVCFVIPRRRREPGRRPASPRVTCGTGRPRPVPRAVAEPMVAG